MGVKAITCYLSERRIFTRDSGRWGLAQIHAILTRTTYIVTSGVKLAQNRRFEFA